MARAVPQQAIEAHLRDDPEIRRCVFRVAAEVAALAKDYANKGPGAGRYQQGLGAGQGVMATAIFAEPTTFGARARSPVDWSAPNESGTGMEGPYKRPVVSKKRDKQGRPKLMVFHVKGGEKIVTRSHKGMPGNRFMSRAGLMVAASSPGLTYRPLPWRVAHI